MMLKWNGLVITVLMALSAACSSDNTQQQPADEPITVEVAKATAVFSGEIRTYTGTVESETASRIGTKIMGRIEQLPLSEGDFARENEVLFRVENGELKARKAQTEAKLKQARAQLKNTTVHYKRIISLFEKGSATEKERDDITAAFESDKAQVNAIESAVTEIDRMLAQTVIKAPYAGFITRKFMQTGDMAIPGQPVVALESLERLKVEMRIPESEVGRFSPGDTVTVWVKAAETTLDGYISHINPSARFSQTHYQATIHLLLPDPLRAGIKPGMYARVEVKKQGAAGLMIPENVLVHRGQLTGLFTINSQNRAVLRWVRTGVAAGGQVEVLSGLKAGEAYITRSEEKLMAGRPVKIIKNQ